MKPREISKQLKVDVDMVYNTLKSFRITSKKIFQEAEEALGKQGGEAVKEATVQQPLDERTLVVRTESKVQKVKFILQPR